jgi:iron complex transport system substrate-binding protein
MNARSIATILAADARTRQAVRDISARANGWGRRPTVAFLASLEPLAVAGGWMAELLDLAGGVPLFSAPGEAQTVIGFDELLREDPDVIMMGLPGRDLAGIRTAVASLTDRPGWSRLRAPRGGRAHLLAGPGWLDQPETRLVEIMEMLAEAIQPAAFRFGHEGMESL